MDAMDIMTVLAITAVALILGCTVYTMIDDSELEETENELEHQYGKEITEIKDFGYKYNSGHGFNAWGTAVTEYGDYMFTYNSATGTTTWVSA